MQITVTVTGLEELVQKVNDPALLGDPLKNFFTKSALTIQRNAQMLTPVDTGRLRASESFTVDASSIPLWAHIGTNVNYAPYAEENTRPHWTSVKNLIGWAARHGINPYALQRKIARKGTTGKHMVRRGLDNSRDVIVGFLTDMARDIENKWGSK